MTSTSASLTRPEAGCPDCTDGLGAPTPVTNGSWRDRIPTKSGLAQVWRIGVFIAGLLCVALGLTLAVLPGPLTIPTARRFRSLSGTRSISRTGHPGPGQQMC